VNGAELVTVKRSVAGTVRQATPRTGAEGLGLFLLGLLWRYTHPPHARVRLPSASRLSAAAARPVPAALVTMRVAAAAAAVAAVAAAAAQTPMRGPPPP
jgi:hypothetical protein